MGTRTLKGTFLLLNGGQKEDCVINGPAEKRASRLYPVSSVRSQPPRQCASQETVTDKSRSPPLLFPVFSHLKHIKEPIIVFIGSLKALLSQWQFPTNQRGNPVESLLETEPLVGKSQKGRWH